MNLTRQVTRSVHCGKVFITRRDMPRYGIEMLMKQCDVTEWKGKIPIPRGDFLKSIKGMNGLLVSMRDRIDKEVLDAAGPDLKVVATMSMGYEHIDVLECRKRGVKIGHTPGVSTDAVADMAIALLLATSRRIPEGLHEARTGGWENWSLTWMLGLGLKGATVGIAGYGKIGQATAKRIKAFNVAQILYFNRSERANDIGAVKVNFEELLAKSDFIICCVALVPEFKELFNKHAFEKMKKTAVFVNVSRGGTVNQDDLVDALRKGVIWGAGLDVTTPEPLPIDHPLFKLKNCVILPHIASSTIQATNAMSEISAKNILATMNGSEMPAELK